MSAIRSASDQINPHPLADKPVILFIAIGLAAGVLAGLFGIGGGIVIGPALILLAKWFTPDRHRNFAGRAASSGRRPRRLGILSARKPQRLGVALDRAGAPLRRVGRSQDGLTLSGPQ